MVSKFFSAVWVLGTTTLMAYGLLGASAPLAQGPTGGSRLPLYEAIRQTESARQGDYAIGDRKLKNKAYGPFQIRKPCLDDVNRLCRKAVWEKFGRSLTLKDVYGNREVSLWVFRRYTSYWGQRLLKRAPTDEESAVLWNGGPGGLERYLQLKEYWETVEAKMKKAKRKGAK